MSSPNSPPLNLELRAHRMQACLAWGAVMLAAGVPVIFLTWAIGAVVGFSAAAAVYLGFASNQWLASSRHVVRLSWLADGRWLAQDATGAVRECELRRNSRVFSHAAWLSLRTADGPCSYHFLLTSFGLQHPSELRRLILRLRLDGIRSPLPAELGEP